MRLDAHAGEQRVEMGGDHLLEGYEPLGVGQRDEAGQQRRNLHAGEPALVARGIVHHDCEVE